jgi:hypothetical protein
MSFISAAYHEPVQASEPQYLDAALLDQAIPGHRACVPPMIRAHIATASGGMMKRMITLVDLKTGAVIARSSDTCTLDVSSDLDSGTAVASLDCTVEPTLR